MDGHFWVKYIQNSPDLLKKLCSLDGQLSISVRPSDDLCKSDREAHALCYENLFTERQCYKKCMFIRM